MAYACVQHGRLAEGFGQPRGQADVVEPSDLERPLSHATLLESVQTCESRFEEGALLLLLTMHKPALDSKPTKEPELYRWIAQAARGRGKALASWRTFLESALMLALMPGPSWARVSWANDGTGNRRALRRHSFVRGGGSAMQVRDLGQDADRSGGLEAVTARAPATPTNATRARSAVLAHSATRQHGVALVAAHFGPPPAATAQCAPPAHLARFRSCHMCWQRGRHRRRHHRHPIASLAIFGTSRKR